MLKTAARAAVFTVLIAGCSALDPLFTRPGAEDFRLGKQLIEQGKPEEGLAALERAFRLDPNYPEYRVQLVQQRAVFINSLLARADEARAGGYLELAEGTYRRVLQFEPQNDKAAAGIEAVKAARRHDALLAEAEKLAKAGRLEEALARTRQVLGENAANARARELRSSIEQRLATARDARQSLDAAFQKQVKLEFRDANLRSIFEVLSRISGVNFVFDRDVRADLRTTIFLNDATLEDAIGMILVSNQLSRKTLNARTVMIYPNTPAKAKEHLELVVRTFYLANTDVKQMLNTIRTLIKTRDIVVDDKLGIITMRDTPEAVRLAEKLVAVHDLPEPEVLLEVEVLEIQRSRLLDLGVVWPNQFTVLNIVPNPTTTTTTGGATTTVVDQTTTTTQLTVATLRNLTSASIGVSPNPQVNLRSDASNGNLLANPRIRVRNKEKARIHIGDKVPVITTTSTANVGVSESVNYLDIGLKLDVEPTVSLDQEVAIKVGLEVSNIAREVTSRQGTLTYQVGTRTATTVLRVKDGETQVLAGLISDQDRSSASRVPGLGNLPIIGRLFSNHHDERLKTEIALLITPRILRGLPQREVLTLEYASGTEAAAGAAPLELQPRSRVAVPPAGPGPKVKPGSTPALKPEAAPEPEPASSPALPPESPPEPPAAPAGPAAQPKPKPGT